jgi:hypothetical protein
MTTRGMWEAIAKRAHASSSLWIRFEALPSREVVNPRRTKKPAIPEASGNATEGGLHDC